MLHLKCAHELSYCIWRSRLQLFRSVIRLHLILFGQKCQTLKRREVCECVWRYGHDWISFIHLATLWEVHVWLLEKVCSGFNLDRNTCRHTRVGDTPFVDSRGWLHIELRMAISVCLSFQYSLHNNWPHCQHLLLDKALIETLVWCTDLINISVRYIFVSFTGLLFDVPDKSQSVNSKRSIKTPS